MTNKFSIFVINKKINMDNKLELLLRAICAYEAEGEANFTLKSLDFFGHENTVRRNIDKLENLITEDGIPYIQKINLNGFCSRYKINKILDCPEFVFDKDLSLGYKLILLALYNKQEELLDILTITNIHKITGIAYNTIKKYFDESLKENLLNKSVSIKLNLSGELENSEYGLKYVGTRKDEYLCTICGEANPDKFYTNNHSTCKKCFQLRKKQILNSDISKKLFDNVKRSYNTRPNISGFNLTREYIEKLLKKQDYKCYYTNTPLQIGDKLVNPTVDRIDSSKGYIEGNVVICTEIANIMKNDLSIEEFKNQIKLLYDNLNKF